jgi:hypothetical protein
LVLICGGREFSNRDLLFSTLDLEPDIGCIVQGGARGADRLAKEWAHSKGIAEFECQAQWKTYGKGAGTKRNTWMVSFMRPDLVIAFPTPDSIGTWNMLRQAKELNIPTKVIKA